MNKTSRTIIVFLLMVFGYILGGYQAGSKHECEVREVKVPVYIRRGVTEGEPLSIQSILDEDMVSRTSYREHPDADTLFFIFMEDTVGFEVFWHVGRFPGGVPDSSALYGWKWD